jgi:hypothetical protein
MDKIAMFRRAVFTSGIEPAKAADMYERFIEVVEDQKVYWSILGLLLGGWLGFMFGILISFN